MDEVLVHPLGPLPWSLANSDGSLRKTNKAALARELEKLASPAEAIPEPSATLIDGMSLVQKMNGNNKTFSQLAESVLAQVMHEGGQSKRIDVIFDIYRGIHPSKIWKEQKEVQNQAFSLEILHLATIYTSGGSFYAAQQTRQTSSGSLWKNGKISCIR